MSTEDTHKQHKRPTGLIPWAPGQSGNPLGRPKGARSKLSETFLACALASFQKHGPETLDRVRIEDPATYIKVMAQLLPKEITGEEGGPLQIVIRRLSEEGK